VRSLFGCHEYQGHFFSFNATTKVHIWNMQIQQIWEGACKYMCTLILLVASICLNWEYGQTVVSRI
jgi:hypothetical protein